MSVSVKIHKAEPMAGGARVIVSLSHAVHETPQAEHLMTSLRTQAKNAMYALASSFSVIDKGPMRTLVQGFMVPAHEAIPVGDKVPAEFLSLSRNMYQDDQDNLWTLRDNEGDGKFLVRANKIDDPSEIQELMKACCSAIAPGSDNHYFTSLSSAERRLHDVEGGDYIAYLQDANLQFGIVVASVQEEGSGEEVLYVLRNSGEDVDLIGREQVAHAAEIGTEVEGATLSIPGELDALANAQAVDALTTYWQKVYGFNPEYFAKLEAIFRGHSFA